METAALKSVAPEMAAPCETCRRRRRPAQTSPGRRGNQEIKNNLLLTSVGKIIIGTIQATGGNASTLQITTGNGGNGSSIAGSGSNGGQGVASPGTTAPAAKAAKIDVESNNTIDAMKNSTDSWNVSGGSVGDYLGKSGNGGKGSATLGTSKIGGGSGGSGGILGDNGTGGDGNEIKIVGLDSTVTVKGALLANGGTVGNYSATGGNGGTGGASGGAGAGAGGSGSGSAGNGGSLSVGTGNGAITTQQLSASGGTVGNQNGTGGTGGTGTTVGGAGGSVGDSGSGGGGGNIKVSTMAAAVIINGDVTANGTNGGDNNGMR